MPESELHAGRESMERFLRAELSRNENQEIIRHLLADCTVCRATLRKAARRQGFEVIGEGAEAVEEIALRSVGRAG